MRAFTQNLPFWVVTAYLIGAVPVGVLIAYACRIDLRAVGSGNIGATNVARALGVRLGLVVFVLDALKAAVPVALAARPWALGSDPAARSGLALVAGAAVAGHVFPVYLRFRGGKGVACAFGVFLALDPPIALGALVMYGQGLWLTRTSAVGSLTAVTALTLCTLIAHKPWPYQVLSVGVAILIWLRHLDNIKTLRARTSL